MIEQKLTYEELLRTEKSLQTYLELNGISGVMLENVKMTAAAIEKQVPKKGRLIPSLDIHCMDRSQRCPVCGKRVRNITYSQSWKNVLDKYCSNCGQKIDWSESSETHSEDIKDRGAIASRSSRNKKQRRFSIFKSL